jgi:hypothetical protein
MLLPCIILDLLQKVISSYCREFNNLRLPLVSLEVPNPIAFFHTYVLIYRIVLVDRQIMVNSTNYFFTYNLGIADRVYLSQSVRDVTLEELFNITAVLLDIERLNRISHLLISENGNY